MDPKVQLGKETDLKEQTKKQLDPRKQAIALAYILQESIKEDKTVRDPVHGDILWNHLETSAIDTRSFQRLRRIRQLGTAHFVYPGAEHSRFEHSLGALHMAKVLFKCVKDNRFSQYQEFGTPPQEMAFYLIIRLAALLHDVQEFPLSHTLEKEGNIFPRQWKNQTFSKRILGKDSEIYNSMKRQILELLGPEESGDTLQGVPSFSTEEKKEIAERITRSIVAFAYLLIKGGKREIKEISNILFESEDIIEELIDKRFLVAGSQIVLDTVCADLLDYLTRDFYFCGIKKNYDERFLKYAVISDLIKKRKDGKKGPIHYPVFAYNLVGKRGELKHSVLSSLFDTLELRYTLAEFVHTHRTKNALSAMAIEAFNYYYQSLNEKERDELVSKLMRFGDDELLFHISENNATSKYILDYYFRRSPYYECIVCTNSDIEDVPQRRLAIEQHLMNPRERLFLQRLLVKFVNYDLPISERLKEGDLLIYVMPNPKRLFKELETNVRYLDENKKPKIGTLLSFAASVENYSSISRSMRMIMDRTRIQRELLVEKFKNLWHVSLFISPEIDYDLIQPMAVALVERFFAVTKCPIQIDPDTEKIELSGKLHERFLSLSKDERSFKRFEDIYMNLS